MSGFDFEPLERINQISALLEGSYKKGFPIIKEIIQNANDGGATSLDFGWTEGLSHANHPLLKTPALFFMNNGGFKKDDQKAIKSYGIDANAGKSDKIGKFGLGQKSVFHFCEAFFYIARSEEVPEGCGSFINPWQPPGEEDEQRPDWKELSNTDRHHLEKYLREKSLITEESLNYFLLWIPLRQKAFDGRYICANYYEDYQSIRNSLPSDMEKKIGLILPLLRYLRSVSFWVEEKNSLKKQFHIQLANIPPASRCIYPKADSDDDKLEPYKGDLFGEIQLSTDSEKISFAGQESILDASEFSILLVQHLSRENFWKQLRKSDLWAKRIAFNKLAKPEPKPDKSIPHCAVIFTKHPTELNRKPKLTLQWAVFLPLASNESDSGSNQNQQEAFEEIECELQGKNDFTIFLHGYFFIDAGRQYISKMKEIRNGVIQPKTPEGSDEMVSQWNYLLATKGTLGLVLQSLNKFYETHSEEQDILNLCDGIKKSQLFTSTVYRNSVCRDHQWIYCIGSDRNSSGWQLRGTEKILELPVEQEGQDIPEFLWSLFPNISDLLSRSILTIKGKPNLIKGKSSWSLEEVKALLENADLFGDRETCETRISYCISWLEGYAKSYFKNVEFQRNFADRLCITWQAITNDQKQVDEIVIATLDKCQSIIQALSDYAAIVRLLGGLISLCESPLKVNTCKCCWNEFIELLKRFSIPLQYTDCLRWLQELGSYLENPKKSARHEALKVVIAILQKSGSNERSRLIEETSAHKILSGQKYTAGQESAISLEQAFSLKELKELQANKTLFSKGKSSANAQDLANLLPNSMIVLVEVETIGEIFSEQILDCTEQTSMAAILLAPSISTDVNVCYVWINRLLACQSVLNNLEICIRYLLHHHPEQRTNRNETLWMIENGSVWIEVANKLIPPWQLLNHDLIGKLTGNEKESLGRFNVKPLTTESIQPFLKNAESKDCSIEILEVIATLEQLTPSLRQTLQNIRWLRDREGMIVAPTSILRLPTTISKYESCLARTEWGKFAISSLDPTIEQYQEALKAVMPPVWTEVQTITFLLERQDCHNYADIILATFAELDNEIPSELRESVQETEWLLVKNLNNESPIAPHFILKFPSLQKMSKFPDCLQDILPDGYALPSTLVESHKKSQSLNIFDSRDESKTIDLILESVDDPVHKPIYIKEKLWQVILKLIDVGKDKSHGIHPKTIERLTSKLWLPSKINDRLLAPNRILALDGLQEVIDPFIQGSNDYASINDVDNTVIITWLREKLFMHRDKTLERLGEILRGKPEYYIGDFDHSELTLSDLVEVFGNILEQNLPVSSLSLLCRVTRAEKFSPESKQMLLSNLRGEADSPRFVEILNSISNHHNKPSETTIRVYNTYLSMACKAFSENVKTHILPKICLLNREQRWKPVTELCYCDRDYKHITSQSVLDDRQADIIRAYIVNRSGN